MFRNKTKVVLIAIIIIALATAGCVSQNEIKSETFQTGNASTEETLVISSAPFPTVDKKQEMNIVDRFGRPVNEKDVIVIGNITMDEFKKPQRFVRDGVIDIVVDLDNVLQQIQVQSNIKIAQGNQFILRVKFYDKQGNHIILNNKYSSKEYAELSITERKTGTVYSAKNGVSPDVGKVELIVYRIDVPVPVKETIPVKNI